MHETVGLIFLIIVIIILLPIILGMFFSNDLSQTETINTTFLLADQNDFSSNQTSAPFDKVQEHVKAGSSLIGLQIDTISVRLAMFNNTENEATVKIWDSSQQVETIFGIPPDADPIIIDSATPAWYNFTLHEGYGETYTIVEGHYFGVEDGGGEGITVFTSTTDVFDGTNSVMTYNETDIDTKDLSFKLYRMDTTIIQSGNESVTNAMNILIIVALVIFILIMLKVAMGYRD